ncbi:NAD(P)/FAD-dependent oxidoreductase [Salinarimonas ramus]|uniref:NAD(P)/FAD-dependent oxidoreductase n=1 Tax=Salinarimonas ramus TaxID=690164 RepID=UPI0016693972|nr:FAD-dependent oxidoreductase [Salinarimonas ramus]
MLYRPDLRRRDPVLVRQEVARIAPDLIIVCAADQALLDAVGNTPDLRIVVFATTADAIEPGTLDHPGVSLALAATQAQAERAAFAEAERRLRPVPTAPAVGRVPGKRVAMVGAGAVNLVTALRLARAGYEVDVFDRMPDPLETDDFPADAVGATFGGLDARIFSYNESRHHLYRGVATRSEIRFRHRISDAGWLSRDLDTLDDEERGWIDRLEAVPPWLAGVYNRCILDYNRASLARWHEIFGVFPALLRGANLVDRLLRVYQTQAAFAAASRSERILGARREILSASDLVAAEPCFADAARSGAVAGALRVEGFSINVKTLSRNIVRLLAARGVRFHWGRALTAMRTDAAGRIASLRFGEEEVVADHVVVSPGAYARLGGGGEDTLPDVASVIGMWITLPNEDVPLATPLKVRRRGFAASEAAEGANVIPGHGPDGRPVIYCSSGHGFVGKTPLRADACDLDELARCIRETAEELFPDKVREARRRGMLDVPPASCIRPWTSSGLGVFVRRETAGGGAAVVTGGHNTGGFAQAPAVAEAVLEALRGGTPEMAELYHPDRATALAEAPTAPERAA